MKPERWKEIEEVYHRAQRRAAGERAAFLDDACAGDEELRRQVESLLRADEEAEGFLGTPALNLAARMIAEEQASSLAGKSISHYEIVERIGAGGMGEVYRARDIRLNRDVAIKVLPANLSQSAEALARFEREARAVAALSHPNILAIHDFGNEQEVCFAVTELLEGVTLRERLSRSALSWREAVEIGIAVADGLSAAHAKGIIHRDLKPENIFVTRDGRVKVLDFGLARVAASIKSVDATAPALPSISEPGVVVGTAGYMSPEQVRGEKVEASSDIFSLGCVLYEMVAGRLAFTGATTAERMAAILRDEPPRLDPKGREVPQELERVITRCLKKKAEERYASARDLASDLKGMLSSADISVSPSARATGRFRPIPWIAAALTLFVIVALTYWLTRSGQFSSTSKAPAAPLKIIPLTSYHGAELFPSFSPDGTQMAFTWDGERQDNPDIYTRTVEYGTPHRLTTDPAHDSSPAWSQDGRLIAFLRHLPNGKAGLFLTTPLSRAERLLTEVAAPGRRGGFWGSHLAWSPDSKWIATADKSSPEAPSGLFLISVETGEKRPIALPTPFAGGVISPAFSPDGRWLAFIRIFGFFVSELYLLALTEDLNARGEPIQLTYFKNQRTASPVWSQDGREIIFASGALNSRLYRIAAAEPGKPQPIESVEDIHQVLAISHAAHRLAYVRAEWDSNIWRLQLGADEKVVGAPSSLIPSTRLEFNPQFSPDGKRVALISDRLGDLEVWVCDSDGSNARPLTSFGGPQADCVRWSPDGERLVFQTYPEGHLDIYLVNVRGGPPERLTHEPSDDNLPSWSRDGRWIYFTSNRSGAT